MDQDIGIQQRGRFPTTRWSLVLSLHEAGTGEFEEAMASLCASYWSPIYVFVSRMGFAPGDAADVVQDFFEDLIENRLLEQAHPGKGRLRTFLLTIAERRAWKTYERARTRKRGGSKIRVSINDPEVNDRILQMSHAGENPQEAYEREWASSLISRVLAEIGESYSRRGASDEFDAMKQYLTPWHAKESYAETAKHLSKSESAVKMAVYRLRLRFREELREVVLDTIDNPDDLEDELRNLLRVFQR